MPSVTAVRGILRTDALRMLRDRFLVGITAYIFFVFFLMRAAIPWATTEILSNWDFDLTPYHPVIASYLVVQLAPWIPGIIGGFLLLESREEGTVKAILVSPNPLSSYLFVVCVVMMVSAVVMVVAEAAILELGLPPWPALIVVAVVAAPVAPGLALMIGAVANNKVEAFAYLKIFGLGPLAATGAFFLPEPWQWIAAVYPPYWTSKAYWVAEAGGAWAPWAVGGMITSAIWLGVLRRVFVSAARRF